MDWLDKCGEKPHCWLLMALNKNDPIRNALVLLKIEYFVVMDAAQVLDHRLVVCCVTKNSCMELVCVCC